MKKSIILAVVTLSALAFSNFALSKEGPEDVECYSFNDGPVEVTVGWMSQEKFKTQYFCLSAGFKKDGWNSGLKITFMHAEDRGTTEYDMSSERYSATDVRFTLADGEPEPTQFDAEMYGDLLISMEVGNDQLLPVTRQFAN